MHVLSPAAGRCADPPGRPKLDRKVRTDRRGGEGRGGGPRARLPRRRRLGGRRLDPQVTCGERPSVRLGATGRPQGSRRTFRTRPAGGGLGHRGAARGRAGRTPGGERGLPQVEQPGAGTAFRGEERRGQTLGIPNAWGAARRGVWNQGRGGSVPGTMVAGPGLRGPRGVRRSGRVGARLGVDLAVCRAALS